MLYVLQWGSLCRRAGSDVGFKHVKHDTVQLYKMCAQWYKTLFHHWSQFFLEFLPFLISQVLEALVLYEMVCLWYDANEPRLLEAYPENPTLPYATSVCSHDDLGFVRVVSHQSCVAMHFPSPLSFWVFCKSGVKDPKHVSYMVHFVQSYLSLGDVAQHRLV